jgi:hypothetical protein
VYQTGAYSSSSSNNSKHASATILNCKSSDFSLPLRGRAFPSNGHGTMLLPSRSLGSLGCGDETGGWRSRSLQHSDEFCKIKSVHAVAAGGQERCVMSPPYFRGLLFIRLVSVILRITAQPVLLQYLRTVVDGPRNYHNVRGAGWDPQRADGGPARGRTCGLPSPQAHHRLKPMKHNLTLDHVKKEARDLLRGLQRRDPKARRRCHAVDVFTDKSRPALDYARIIIARERGFSSWRKLKEHIENSAVDC